MAQVCREYFIFAEYSDSLILSFTELASRSAKFSIFGIAIWKRPDFHRAVTIPDQIGSSLELTGISIFAIAFYRICDFFSVYWDTRWGCNTQSDSISTNFDNFDYDVIADENGFVSASAQN